MNWLVNGRRNRRPLGEYRLGQIDAAMYIGFAWIASDIAGGGKPQIDLTELVDGFYLDLCPSARALAG
ncbi:hypothetical protein [Rhizobium jaguaris]|uniref:Uncharacterized protein n=1 Tax=Rhizobium jaguaris TaxID=1312183 RepID=A0A387G0M4_9HYPH|nr:hypothetical protein [Rhizobium jaguaris]AYG64098.1 hypothetical protein CCGE525_35450 [Rhizobium jaguaris]